jgi:signal transduction histidine kinase
VEAPPEGTGKKAEAAPHAVALAKRLQALERVRRTFISDASHELKTPLTPLRIHVEALLERGDLNEEQRAHLVTIERNVLRLADLVQGMLDASQVEAGALDLHLADVALAEVVRQATEAMTPAALRAGVDLEFLPVGRAIFALGDRPRIGQVLHDLLDNAIAFTRRGGRVTVTCRSDGGQAVVEVRDTGVGLSEDQVAQLFQPFARPHDTTPSGRRGAGLRLFIAKGLLEQQGGRIWAESSGPGTGTAVSIALPLAAAALPIAPEPQAQSIGLVGAMRPRTESASADG